jgi:hypothetical protein
MWNLEHLSRLTPAKRVLYTSRLMANKIGASSKEDHIHRSCFPVIVKFGQADKLICILHPNRKSWVAAERGYTLARKMVDKQ